MRQKNSYSLVQSADLRQKVGLSSCLLMSFGASVRDKGEDPTLVMVTVMGHLCSPNCMGEFKYTGL